MLIQTNARLIPLRDESVQAIITSPPYFGLRSYEGNQVSIWDANPYCHHQWRETSRIVQTPQRDHGEGGGWAETRGTEPSRAGRAFISSQGQFCSICGGWRGAFGLEPEIALYVSHSIQILSECYRVLRHDGICFWVIADSYSFSARATLEQQKSPVQIGNKGSLFKPGRSLSIPKKNLCLVPEHLAVACQQAGWNVRQKLVWAKNSIPESVKDRCSRSHEFILMLTKSDRYFWDHAAAQELASSSPQVRRFGKKQNGRNDVGALFVDNGFRNLRDVWKISASSYRGRHKATFPVELARRCISLASRPGSLILDCFCGAGTTGIAAEELRRTFVGIDLAECYLKEAHERMEKHREKHPAPRS
jgi:site-specific DNA-methyltransferase (cytosine-N4-specific)